MSILDLRYDSCFDFQASCAIWNHLILNHFFWSQNRLNIGLGKNIFLKLDPSGKGKKHFFFFFSECETSIDLDIVHNK